MKILEPGKARSWSRECRCTGSGNGNGGCGALLLVEKTDLYQTYRSFMGREEEWFVTFCCPQCQVQTDLDNTPFTARSLPTFKEKQAREQAEAAQ